MEEEVTIESAKLNRKESMDNNKALLSLLDDDDKNIWSGFLTRNKQHRVLIEAYEVSGENNNLYLADHDHNLNVSHRTNYDDVGNYKVQG